jgi:hypothetical protein
MRVSARRRGRCHPRGTPTWVPVVTMGTRAGAMTDANDDDPPCPSHGHRVTSNRGFYPRIFVEECGIEGHARGTHPSSSTEPMLYMTAAIVHVAVDRARVG